MDGQHRIATMERLYARHRDVPLNFHFRVTVCASEKEAHEHLIHFQDCFPADPRAFFETQQQTRLGTAVVDELHKRHPGVFKEPKLSGRMGGGYTADPPRPYLNDYVAFWLLKESKLLAAKGADSESVLERLAAMSRLLASLQRGELGDGASEHMRASARACGCFLGFFREGKLEWATLARRLPPPPAPAPSPAAASRIATAATRGTKRERSDGEAASSGATSGGATSGGGAGAAEAGAVGEGYEAKIQKLTLQIKAAQAIDDAEMAASLKQRLMDL